MALFDLLGRRWTLRVVWELREEAVTFRQLQERCEGMSSSVLNQRLRDLREAGVVAPEGRRGYRLTTEGEALLEALSPLQAWASRWAERTRAARPPAPPGFPPASASRRPPEELTAEAT